MIIISLGIIWLGDQFLDLTIFDYCVKMGPIFVTSAYLHCKNFKDFIQSLSLLGKNNPNFVNPKLIIHNQSHATTH